MGKNNKSLYMTLVSYDDGVKRKFGKSYTATKYGESIQYIVKENADFIEILSRVFAEIHNTDSAKLSEFLSQFVFQKIDSVLTEEQRVPWYLSEFLTPLRATYKSGLYSEYIISVKACKDYYLYTLKGKTLDQKKWELLHIPFFQKATPPINRREGDLEKARGIVDTIFFLAPKLIELKNSNPTVSEFSNFISWFNIELQCLVKENGYNGTFELEINPKIGTSKYISFPANDKEVLVASPNIRSAIETLSESWRNPMTKTIILSAASGSGKEVLINLLAGATNINEKGIIKVSAPEIKNFEELRKNISDKLSKDIITLPLEELPENVSRSDKFKNSNLEYNGGKLSYKGFMPKEEKNKLIKFSQDKYFKRAIEKIYHRRLILFLDEIHHKTALEIRSGLLRVIETNKLQMANNEELNCDPILYVFAASLPPEQLYTIDPPDFWTRMEYIVKLIHPLRIEDSEERKKVLKEYFLLFWNLQRDEWEKFNEQDVGKITSKLLDRLDKEWDGRLADKFVEELSSALIPLVSIRVLRIVIKRLFSRTINYLRLYPQLNKGDMGTEAYGKFKEWIGQIFSEIVPKMNTKGLF